MTDPWEDPLILGCEQLGGTDWGQIDVAEVSGAVEAAWQSGVRAFDTADVYGLGLSEQRLATVLAGSLSKAKVISKGGIHWQSTGGGRARTWRDGNPEHLRIAIERSLERLKIDRLDAYLLHWPDPEVPVDVSMTALANAKQAGLARLVGLSNPRSITDLQAALRVAALDVVQVNCNLLSIPREVLSFCEQNGIPVLAYGVLAQGLLAGDVRTSKDFDVADRRHRLPHYSAEFRSAAESRLRTLRELSAAAGVGQSQLALRATLELPGVAGVIFGARNADQVRENVSSLSVNLPDDWQRLL
jgi:myo-inositol catabolism protein IolS